MTFKKISSYYLNEPGYDSLPGIGPHAFRELKLMLAGVKPLALFYDVIPPSIELPEADFEPFIKAGRLVKRIALYRDDKHGIDHRYLYYSLPKEEWHIDEMQTFTSALFSWNYRFDPDDERRIGRLLGYDEQDIETYIAHTLKNRQSNN